MDTLIRNLKKEFDLSFRMLETLTKTCPPELWTQKKGGFVYWQQLLHALTGMNFWMRMVPGEFAEPFQAEKVYPELEKDPETHLTRDQLLGYLAEVKALVGTFFDGRDDAWLRLPCAAYGEVSHLKVILMQIRHIQYHVGSCDAILREGGWPVPDWLDDFGNSGD